MLIFKVSLRAGFSWESGGDVLIPFIRQEGNGYRTQAICLINFFILNKNNFKVNTLYYKNH